MCALHLVNITLCTWQIEVASLKGPDFMPGQVAQSLDQDYLQLCPRVELPHLSGQPVPEFDHSHAEKRVLLQKRSPQMCQTHIFPQRQTVKPPLNTDFSVELWEILQCCGAHYETSVCFHCLLQPKLSLISAFWQKILYKSSEGKKKL